jgi:hypothetical protein
MEMLSSYLHGGTEKNHAKLINIADILVDFRINRMRNTIKDS